MRIAVSTPNGNVGRHVTRMLVQSGVRPVLLMRHPEHLSDELRDYVDVAAADSWHPDEVIAATRGVDAVYWVDPTPFSADPLGDYARATEAIVGAVRENGLSRVVFQSSVGAEKRGGAGEIDGLAATEAALDELAASSERDLDVCHLRCGYFFSNLALDLDALRAGELETVLPLDQGMPWVAPRDIAEVVALTLLSTAWSGRRVQAVHGPENLSWAHVASLLTSELGHDVTVRRVEDDVMRQRYLEAGLPPALGEALLGMSTGLRDDFTPEQKRSLVSTTPTTLRSWVREELIPLL